MINPISWRPRSSSAVAFAVATSLVGAGSVALLLARPGQGRSFRSDVVPRALDGIDASSTRDTQSMNGTRAVELLVNALVGPLQGDRAVIGGLEFVAGSDTLARSADAVLARLASALRTAPGTFLIEAHVASSGDPTADQWLTDRRAAAVRARLVAAGVPADKLFAMGFGSTRAARVGARSTSRIEVSQMP